MTSWNRRLEAAGRAGTERADPRGDLLAEAADAGVVPEDLAALSALAAVARDRPGFSKSLEVRAEREGVGVNLVFEVAHRQESPVVRQVGAAGAAVPPLAPAPEEEAGGFDGNAIVQILTDTHVETPDMVAIFAGLGHEAVWANDAFATMIPIREADQVWLVELLDEWSQGNFEVKVLPALAKYGRWRGRLTFLTGDENGLLTSAVLVAHRDRQGEIDAVTMIARDLSELRAAEDQVVQSETRLAALVENAADLIAVIDARGFVEYASPGTTRLLGLVDGALVGTDLMDLVHPEDRPANGFAELVHPDDRGIGSPVELRLRHESGSWRHLEVVVSDLTDNPAIAGLVLNARDVTQRVEAVALLAARAYTDPVTDLPNRVRLLDRIGQALSDAAAVGGTVVVLVDLDGFKAINERLGGEVGNKVLKEVAARMSDLASDSVTVGRLGSDEFVLLLRDVGNLAEALHLGNRVRAAISKPIVVDGDHLTVTASMGVAAARAGQEPEDLIRDADRAMTHAKSQGRDRIELYDDNLARVTTHRRAVEDKLRHALDHEGVRVHFQPIVDVESDVVVAAEALLRVHDEDGAVLSPAEFIEAAESTGLIARLGSQVLEFTLGQLAAWSHSPAGGAPSEVSVNISPRQLADPDLPKLVVSALEAVSVAPERLCLEITESILIGAQPTVDAGISYLRALGVKIGLDDFGTGQSSLGYLKRFPLDFVKIDRSLLAGLGTSEADTAIVRATIELCRTIGLTTVAVGVENDEQLEYLRMLGCNRAQGYHFGPPMPAADLISAVSARSTRS